MSLDQLVFAVQPGSRNVAKVSFNEILEIPADQLIFADDINEACDKINAKFGVDPAYRTFLPSGNGDVVSSAPHFPNLEAFSNDEIVEFAMAHDTIIGDASKFDEERIAALDAIPGIRIRQMWSQYQHGEYLGWLHPKEFDRQQRYCQAFYVNYNAAYIRYDKQVRTAKKRGKTFKARRIMFDDIQNLNNRFSREMIRLTTDIRRDATGSLWDHINWEFLWWSPHSAYNNVRNLMFIFRIAEQLFGRYAWRQFDAFQIFKKRWAEVTKIWAALPEKQRAKKGGTRHLKMPEDFHTFMAHEITRRKPRKRELKINPRIINAFKFKEYKKG